MRSPGDRLRYALSFEILALVLFIPLGAVLFDTPIDAFGVVGVVSAVIAMLWNMIFNFGFDVVLQRLANTTQKKGLVRILHAVLFEATLLVVLMPFIAWYLEVSVARALVMDVSIAAFYMAYAFVFGWAYDRIFPLPEWENAAR